MLPATFFNRDPCVVARALLGKVLRVKHGHQWLSAKIIETEAYYLSEKASHASLGYTEKRKGLFMPPGTIYMYYARGGDSLNISCRGKGNAVLIKSAFPFLESGKDQKMIKAMRCLNPRQQTSEPRPVEKLCAGQTLLCRSLGLKVPEWDQKAFDPQRFYIDDAAYVPQGIVRTTRLGIPEGRDGHLFYRFIDVNHLHHCTQNPLRKRGWRQGKEYFIIAP